MSGCDIAASLHLFIDLGSVHFGSSVSVRVLDTLKCSTGGGAGGQPFAPTARNRVSARRAAAGVRADSLVVLWAELTVVIGLTLIVITWAWGEELGDRLWTG